MVLKVPLQDYDPLYGMVKRFCLFQNENYLSFVNHNGILLGVTAVGHWPLYNKFGNCPIDLTYCSMGMDIRFKSAFCREDLVYRLCLL